jgi:predicted Zn-dependent protease
MPRRIILCFLIALPWCTAGGAGAYTQAGAGSTAQAAAGSSGDGAAGNTAFVAAGSTAFVGSRSAAPAGAQLSINGKKVTAQQFRGAELANEGMELLRQNRNSEAVEKLREAVTLYPELAEAYHNLGLALAKLGDSRGALEALDKARSLKDIDATWLTLGGLYQANGQIAEAIAVYRDFIVRFPTHQMVQSGKLESLIKGLEHEGGAMLSNPAITATEDYVQDVTKSGVVRWPSIRMPIRVHIADGAKVAGYQSEYSAILSQSFEDWSRASGGLVRFDTTSGATQADLVCLWISDPSLMTNQAEAGETQVFGNRSVGINRGKILLLTQPLSPALPVTRSSIRLICLHEIGHALGLTGHTVNPSDIMFYSTSYKDEWRHLSVRDAKTITRLYSSP